MSENYLNGYTVYSPFDLEKHKKTFINYFEAIINPDGSIEYAAPSHAEICYRKYGEKHNCGKTEIFKKFCHPFDVAADLGIILCWNNYVHYRFTPTEEQLKTLEILKREKLIELDNTY